MSNERVTLFYESLALKATQQQTQTDKLGIDLEAGRPIKLYDKRSSNTLFTIALTSTSLHISGKFNSPDRCRRRGPSKGANKLKSTSITTGRLMKILPDKNLIQFRPGRSL